MSKEMPEAKLPQQTPEYLKARAPLLAKLKTATAPHWARYLAGEVTHEQYRGLIAPALKTYHRDIDPYFLKAGGVNLPTRA